MNWARTNLIAGLILLVPSLAGSQGKWPPREVQIQTWNEFHQELNLQCKEKKLEWLTYGDLDLQIESFEEILSESQMRTVTSNVEASCRGVDVGTSCSNVGFLYTAIRGGYLKKFVHAACASGTTCTSPFECEERQ